ncbi:MAG: alanine racemase [Bacteroidota bacterium]
MKLNYSHKEFIPAVLTQEIFGPKEFSVQEIVYDSRRINSGDRVAFFALKGDFRDGHEFIDEAYKKGVRIFIVERIPSKPRIDASFILVENVLNSLQNLAVTHRNKFTFPVVSITGTLGKTMVKEWAFHLAKKEVRIIRSPKSFNSQLGVALSILELNENCDLALFEAAVTRPGEMKEIQQMIQPIGGVLTNVLISPLSHFSTLHQKATEYLELFKNSEWLILPSELKLSAKTSKPVFIPIKTANFEKEMRKVVYSDEPSKKAALLSIALLRQLNVLEEKNISSLPRLAMRLETFDGKDNSIIINDTYNLDNEALVSSLSYQRELAGNKRRVVVIGLSEERAELASVYEQLIRPFSPDELIISANPTLESCDLTNAVVLLKGNRSVHLERLAQKLRSKQHTTELLFNLSALKHNVQLHKKLLPTKTKILAMVKAQAYGAGLEKIGVFLENMGINYLGVAYSDEGVELRKAGVEIPILVMNPEIGGFEDCLVYKLQPAIFSFDHLDAWLRFLISEGIYDFPVQLKLDTGMRRLGFQPEEVPRLMEILAAQPEIKIAGVYSHLADADNVRDKRFTLVQIERFKKASDFILSKLNYPVIRHILNSEGVTHFPEAAFDMVRVGIGMFGLSSNINLQRRLLPVISWKSVVSQVKKIHKGESVGYARTFVATEETQIATIPLGYADGFRRSLSNGKGGVYIQKKFCPVVGRVCMDMIMVDIGKLKVSAGDEVEIIGEKQSLAEFSNKMQTIPYEVLTGISKRVHRRYFEES